MPCFLLYINMFYDYKNYIVFFTTIFSPCRSHNKQFDHYDISMIYYFRTWKVHKCERTFCKELSLHRTECLPVSSWSVSLYINGRHEKKASVSIDHAILNWPSAARSRDSFYTDGEPRGSSRVFHVDPEGFLRSFPPSCSVLAFWIRATLYCTHGRYIRPKCSALVPPYWFKLLIVNLSPSRAWRVTFNAATTTRIFFFDCLFIQCTAKISRGQLWNFNVVAFLFRLF